MKKASKIIAILLMAVLSLSAFACGGTAEFTWDKEDKPSYKDTYAVGDKVTIQEYKCTVGKKEAEVKITVTDPDGEKEKVAVDDKITLKKGDYTITYEASSGKETSKKKFSFEVKDSSSGGGGNTPSGGGSSTSGIWSIFGTMAANGEEADLTVAGNVATIKRQIAESDYKGVVFRSVNAAGLDTDQTHIDITIQNNTTGTVEFYYKVTTNSGVDKGNGSGVGYTEHKIAQANGSATLTCQLFTYDQSATNATAITQAEIFFITSASSGTITVNITEHAF